MQWLKNIFRSKTANEMAAQELATAELSLLEANSACEYAASVIDYNKARIHRLRGFLSAQARQSTGAAESVDMSSQQPFMEDVHGAARNANERDLAVLMSAWSWGMIRRPTLGEVETIMAQAEARLAAGEAL